MEERNALLGCLVDAGLAHVNEPDAALGAATAGRVDHGNLGHGRRARFAAAALLLDEGLELLEFVTLLKQLVDLLADGPLVGPRPAAAASTALRSSRRGRGLAASSRPPRPPRGSSRPPRPRPSPTLGAAGARGGDGPLAQIAGGAGAPRGVERCVELGLVVRLLLRATRRDLLLGWGLVPGPSGGSERGLVAFVALVGAGEHLRARVVSRAGLLLRGRDEGPRVLGPMRVEEASIAGSPYLCESPGRRARASCRVALDGGPGVLHLVRVVLGVELATRSSQSL